MVDHFELLQRNICDEMKQEGFGLKYNFASMNEYLLETSKLLELCKDEEAFNKLYSREFRKIETYDEEEEDTID